MCLKTPQDQPASPRLKAPPHQPVLADDQQAFGAAQLRQADLLVESAVAPHHHGDAVREAPLRDVGGGAQHGGGQVVNLEAGLRHRTSGTQLHPDEIKMIKKILKFSNKPTSIQQNIV